MKYCEPGGAYRMELDLIGEATQKAKKGKKAGSKSARSRWEKRKQKRAKQND